MRFTREQAENRAKERPPGYLEELLAESREIAPGFYELTGEPMVRLMKKYAPYRTGAGTALKHIIHAGLDVAPIPAAMRQKIKGCGGCARREQLLNRLVPDIKHPFQH